MQKLVLLKHQKSFNLLSIAHVCDILVLTEMEISVSHYQLRAKSKIKPYLLVKLL